MSRISTSLSLRMIPLPMVSMPRRPALPMSCVNSPLVSGAQLTPRQRFAASAPREDEVDGGQQAAPAQLLDHAQHVVLGSTARIAPARVVQRVDLRELERAPRRVALAVEERVQLAVDGKPH